MLISIIHRVNRAQGLNLDPLNSLGVDKDAGGEGEVLGWRCSMGLQVSGGGGKQGPLIPSLCLLGSLNHNGNLWILAGRIRRRQESSAKGMLSRREGKPVCAGWPLCARLDTWAVGGSRCGGAAPSFIQT